MPETFAPTYRLLYGSPGRSLAIEIAARLGMPASVIAFARENLSDREKQLAEHLARVDDDLRRLEADRRTVAKDRAALVDTERALRSREESVRERENTYRRRLDAKLDDQLREGRREIDTIIEGLKAKTAELTQQAVRRAAASSTLARRARCAPTRVPRSNVWSGGSRRNLAGRPRQRPRRNPRDRSSRACGSRSGLWGSKEWSSGCTASTLKST